jgi:hypothetical protein
MFFLVEIMKDRLANITSASRRIRLLSWSLLFRLAAGKLHANYGSELKRLLCDSPIVTEFAASA